jgi:dipeptidyl aminopeptidase/acylaminoacyl peptidase
MQKAAFFFCFIMMCLPMFAQKKALDHSVYDGWQSIGEHYISNDGKFVVYTVNPQEGDGTLVIQSSDNSYKKEVSRGYNVTITEDSRFVIFRIKPFFNATREAKIKKKTPEQMPKDSLGILIIGKDSLVKIPGIKSYKTPKKGNGWVAFHYEKGFPFSLKTAGADSLIRLNNLLHTADSLAKVADSLRNKAAEARLNGLAVLEVKEAGPSSEPVIEGTDMVLRNLLTGEEKRFGRVSDYYFTEKGNVLLIETTKKNGLPGMAACLLWMNTTTGRTDTVMKGFNDAKNYAFDKAGEQLAFVAERDSAARALRKFYKLWYYRSGMDSARLRADRFSSGVAGGYTISPDYENNFSRDGKQLFIGLTLIRPPKDTSLMDFETARLDVWNYKDDYLQPQQLIQLDNELKKSWLAVIHDGDNRVLTLADENCETVIPSDEGNGLFALGRSTKGYRIRQQWEQNGLEKIFIVNTLNGSKRMVQDKVRGPVSISPGGKFILWYDWKKRNWFTSNTVSGSVTPVTNGIRFPLFDEEDDHPDDPPPHGTMGWQESDRYVYIYDKFDIWKCDPLGKETPVCITSGNGRKYRKSYRFIKTDAEQRFFKDGDTLVLARFDLNEKNAGFCEYVLGGGNLPALSVIGPYSVSGFFKAKNAGTLCYLKGSYDASPDIYVRVPESPGPVSTGKKYTDNWTETKLSAINPQQKEYNWFTVELHKWKMFDGRMSEGLLYKPENFDSTKKYPVIFYFYERDADTRYNYIAPQPVRASINIPYFVSNGYLVFDPNIYYKTGRPGEDAYNSVVSAAKYLSRYKWVDTARMGLQGHSWGGYQVAYLVTRTNLFAAAEAGAPVANMTSAYGGIRWGAGISREFQYEKTQSRIGATLWQRPDLYLKNSPLFRADAVRTPLLMMHNDADGAVPWYQGIEYFTALRRLGKKVWLMQYNGEDHGLMERKNRKDWSLRLSQFFDYFLKGEKPARWITDGVPATLKGIDWGTGAAPGTGF